MTQNDLRNLRRRVSRARSFPANTCAASRCLHGVADDLLRYGMSYRINESPRDVAEEILVLLEELWRRRSK